MFLTHDEIKSLTGRAQPKRQRDMLASGGWVFEVDANGRPVVLRSYAERKLGSQPPKRSKQPNFDALRDVT